MKKWERRMNVGALLKDDLTDTPHLPGLGGRGRGRQILLPVDHIPPQNIAVPTTSLDQAAAVPHNHLPKEGWCLLGCQQPPAKGQRIPAKQIYSPPGDIPVWTGHPDLWVVTCLVLSPTEGRVEGCREGMAVARLVGMMVMGEEGWMQRAGGMQGRVELSPPPQVHVQQTATHQVSRPQSTVYCPALSRVRWPCHCYCHTSDRGKRLSSGLEGS